MAAEKRRLAYAAVLPLILLTLRFLPSDSPSGRGRGGETLAAPAARYVVRFLEYRPAEHHREYLEAGLRGAASPSWRWVERRNPAAAHPTDFAVLEIRDAHRDAVSAAVRALARVRDVHVDTSYSRGVLSVDRPLQQRQRPGKRFTAMSFESEEDGGDGNDAVPSQNSSSSSCSWRRKLQMQVHFSRYSWWKHLCTIVPLPSIMFLVESFNRKGVRKDSHIDISGNE